MAGTYKCGTKQNRVAGEVEILGHEHEQMHEGNFYFVKGWLDVTGAATTSYFMFRTPAAATKIRIHAKVALAAEAEFDVTIFEDATVSADGTPVPRFNVDRDVGNGSLLVPFAGPTVTDDGTAIWPTKVGAAKTAGVSATRAYEIIAKTDSVYLFKIIKIAAGTHYIDYDFYWYEEDTR